MNAAEKIKRSWWVILSFIFMLNGFGFVYLGLKNNNNNWILEGLTYEIPWIIGLLTMFDDPILEGIVAIGLILWVVSIIRSFWLAIKLADVYDNEDKYTVRPVVMANHDNPKKNDNTKTNIGCCLCLIAIFMVFVIVAH